MMERWLKHNKLTLNTIDKDDAEKFLLFSQNSEMKQGQPEYAQQNYLKMISME